MNNLLQYLEATAARLPDKIAFEDTASSVTYGRLLQSARSIGTALGAVTGPRRAVAVYMDKGVDAVTSFMGALYAGCYYCFIDPKQPQARNQTMLKTLNPGAVICSKATIEADCPVLSLGDIIHGPVDEDYINSIRRGHIDIDPAYCSFTSGSTGAPKGVLVNHRSVIDFIGCFTELFNIGEGDVLACQSPFDFDVSVKDIYSCLKTGGSAFLIPKHYFVFLPNLMETLEAKGVTTLIWAVSALCLLSERGALDFLRPHGINKVLFSGEVMPANHLLAWKEHYPEAMYVNLYGPTEITCNCTYHILPKDYSGGDIPIGRPFPNERVFLLDDGNNPVTDPGKTGEICVTGTALALGYCSNREQTALAFCENPLCPSWNETMYRTGDMGRYGEDGLLYYAGRRDHQIKRHGRRVELGEIEKALHSAPAVSRACVLYLAEESALVAFMAGEQVDRKTLVAQIKGLLPDYMIPDHLLWLDQLPLNDHGKLDRKALLAHYNSQQGQ